MKRTTMLAALGAVALTAAAAGYLLSTRGGEPPALRTATARQVPATRPEFTLTDSTGQARAISEWDGSALIINFWATWCPPCRREIPLLNALHARHLADGFQVIGVAVDFREDVLNYMQDTPIDYPVLIGEQDGLDAARAFGMETMGFPFTVFTDKRGRIVTIHVGELHEPEAAAILSAVADVDAGRLTLEAARSDVEQAVAASRAESRRKSS
jgi:thiol-disulfide isomerase/thioredoxin